MPTYLAKNPDTVDTNMGAFKLLPNEMLEGIRKRLNLKSRVYFANACRGLRSVLPALESEPFWGRFFSNNPTPMGQFVFLPAEVLSEIYERLDLTSKVRFVNTCKGLRGTLPTLKDLILKNSTILNSEPTPRLLKLIDNLFYEVGFEESRQLNERANLVIRKKSTDLVARDGAFNLSISNILIAHAIGRTDMSVLRLVGFLERFYYYFKSLQYYNGYPNSSFTRATFYTSRFFKQTFTERNSLIFMSVFALITNNYILRDVSELIDSQRGNALAAIILTESILSLGKSDLASLYSKMDEFLRDFSKLIVPIREAVSEVVEDVILPSQVPGFHG